MDLQIPTLHNHGKQDFDTSPDAVRQWITDLPLVNADKTADELLDVLNAMNGLQIPARDRLEDLELLAVPVASVIQTLNRQYLGKRFPLDGKSQARANLASSLHLQMATGYKIVAAELSGKRRSGAQLGQAIHAAIHHLGEALLNSYIIYAPCSAGIWRDLHGLYELALARGLADNITDETKATTGVTGSIANHYRQCLLLSLASPYRMRQREIRSVYALLCDWAPHCRLHTPGGSNARGYFACNLDADEPPRYLQHEQRDRLDSRWLVIDTAGLEEPVHATIAAQQESTARLSTLPDAAALQRLMLSWGMMPKRRFPRRGNESRVRLVLGLSAIHQALGGSDKPSPANRTAGDESVQDDQYLRDPTFERTTVIDTTPASDADAINPFRGSYTPGSGGGDRELRIEAWKMQDMSAGGYCLLWDSAETSNAHVGELVAISEDDGDEDWHLGVVRWMRFTPAEGLALGVQMLSPGARPVWASLCKDQAGMEDRMQGILLPEVVALDQPATLLLSPLPFHTGCLSTVSDADGEITVRLTGHIEDTGSFTQFLFTAAGDAG
jgi:hypothetical protein